MPMRVLCLRINCDASEYLLEIKNGYDLPLRKVVSDRNNFCLLCHYRRYLAITLAAEGQKQTAFFDLGCHHPTCLSIFFPMIRGEKQTFTLVDSTYGLPVKTALLDFNK